MKEREKSKNPARIISDREYILNEKSAGLKEQSEINGSLRRNF
jgi:hypothetical protein